jgi:hypothetical protein
LRGMGARSLFQSQLEVAAGRVLGAALGCVVSVI